MPSLRQKAVEGTKWSAMSQGLTTGLQLLQLVVLARLLSPSDFGLIAMGMVVVGFARAFQDMGLSNAIIHRQDATPEGLSSLYWANVGAGTISFLVVWASTPVVTSFFAEPRVGDLMFWLALSLVISSLGHQFAVLLQKNLQFQLLALVQVTTTALGTTAAITAAIMDQGLYALIWGHLTHATTMSLALLIIGLRFWRPQLRLRGEDLRPYLSFGMYQMGERTVNYFASNVDNLLIGRFLGPEALGVYSIAYNLIIMPVRKVNPVLTKVAFPILARKQNDDAALRRGYLEMIGLLGFIVVPVLIGLAVTAPLVVPVMFGDRWLAGVAIIQILAFVGITKALGNPIGSILMAKGRADIGFKWNVFVAILNSLVFYVAVQFSLLSLALAYAAVSTVYLIGGRFLLRHVINLGWLPFLRALSTPVLCGLIMGIAVYFSHQAMLDLEWPNEVKLTILIALGIGAYSLSSLALAYNYLRSLACMFLNRKPKSV